MRGMNQPVSQGSPEGYGGSTGGGSSLGSAAGTAGNFLTLANTFAPKKEENAMVRRLNKLAMPRVRTPKEALDEQGGLE